MAHIIRRPHDTALSVHFSLTALRQLLQLVGVFDQEGGDEVHGVLSLLEDTTDRLAEQLDGLEAPAASVEPETLE